MPHLVSIQVGMPEVYGDPAASHPNERQWRTGIFKEPVNGPCVVTSFGLEGDGQADLTVHGGPDKAILAYSADHYPHWREILQREEIGPGGFGENLTLGSLDEQSVCIGDEWEIGSVRLQVSQPRQPCWKLARRWGIPELPKLVVQSGWSGWYFRILTSGEIHPGEACHLKLRPHPDWPISRCSKTLYDKTVSYAEGEELAGFPELSPSWQEGLLGKIQSRM